MSNLQLPKMTHANLSRLAPANKGHKKVAYETCAHNTGSDVLVMHHNSVIAELSDDNGVYITNAGWGSSTTRQRLHKILADNFRTETGSIRYGLTQKNFVQILIDHKTGTKYPEFVSAEFDTFGNLVNVNGESVGA